MENDVIAVIYHNIARSVIWNGKDLPTNKDIRIPWSDAVKLSKMFEVSMKEVIKKPYNKENWKNKTYGFTGDADNSSGFGNCTVNLLRQSDKNGYDVRWVGRSYEVPDILRLSNKEMIPDIGMVWHEQPNHKWKQSPFERNICILPFETTKIPDSWVSVVNNFDAVLVPCLQNVFMMKDSGVTRPIELIHWGVDETKFKKVSRIPDEFFTFGHMGSLSTRKGMAPLTGSQNVRSAR